MRYRIEWPSWGVIAVVYTAWLLLVFYSESLSLLARYLLLSLTLAWHSSMTHEIIHDHPSSLPWLNDALGLMPLSLIPYFDYKASHLKHHDNSQLTVPEVDPESFLIKQERYHAMGAIRQFLAQMNMTLVGRLLLLAPRSVIGISKRTNANWRSGTTHDKLHSLADAAALAAVIVVITLSSFPLSLYLACAWTALLLIGLRAFYEHRPHPEPAARSVIVEAAPFWRWLYLPKIHKKQVRELKKHKKTSTQT